MEPYAPPSLKLTNAVTVKLTEKNYILWKRQFEAFLNGQRLLGFVTGSTPQPSATIPAPSINGTTTPAPNPDYALWFQTDQAIQSWLLGSFSEDVQSSVVHCTSSSEIWMTLASHFNRPTSARLFELQRKLQTTVKQDRSMDDYLRDIKTICDQLMSIGQPVDERMKIFAVLLGLGKEYEPTKTSIEGSMDTQYHPTFEDVVPRLVAFDDRLKSYSTDAAVTPHLAFNTVRGRPFFTRSRGRNRGGITSSLQEEEASHSISLHRPLQDLQSLVIQKLGQSARFVVNRVMLR